MNETQADQLVKELEEAGFAAFHQVGVHDPKQVYEVLVLHSIITEKDYIPSCDLCKNRFICLVNQRLGEIAPIMATATLSMKISPDINRLLAKECKRFQR